MFDKKIQSVQLKRALLFDILNKSKVSNLNQYYSNIDNKVRGQLIILLTTGLIYFHFQGICIFQKKISKMLKKVNLIDQNALKFKKKNKIA